MTSGKPNPSLELARDFLFEALSEPIGVLIRTSEPDRMRQLLYRARTENPDFEPLSIIASPWPDEGQWCIVKGKIEMRKED